MYREHTVGVVIPAYNEEGFIGDVITGMPDYVDRMYVVDDCSSDGTWNEIIEAAHKDYQQITDSDMARSDDSESAVATTDGGSVLPEGVRINQRIERVIPIQHEENQGLGGTLKTGYLAALQDDIEIVVKVDGDGQMDLSYMPKLLDPIVDGEADYTKGNRLLYREYREEMPAFRFIGNSILTFLTKISSGYWKTMDPQNGYTAISNYALENVGIENMYEYYGYCNDLLVKLNAKGMKVADVAIPAKYGDEESSIKYPTYIRKVSGMLLRNFFWRMKVKYLVLDFHPLAMFYFFGIMTTLIGVGAGVWSVYAKLALGDGLFLRAALSLMLFCIGSMFIMFAMLFDMQVNKDKEVQVHE